MSRGRKIALIVGGSLLGLDSPRRHRHRSSPFRPHWFRNFVRTKIVATVEEATGGRVELGSFNFTWNQLRADVNDFVIHGLEPAGAAPLLRAKHVQVDLKLLSPLERLRRSRLSAGRHAAGQPDGLRRTGRPIFPRRKSRRSPATSPAWRPSSISPSAASTWSTPAPPSPSQPAAFNASGQNLRAHLDYNHRQPELHRRDRHRRRCSSSPATTPRSMPM